MKSLIRALLSHGSHVLVVGLAALWPVVSLAQTAPPPPSLNRVPQPWVGYLVMALLLAVVLAVSLMPSKRSHQD